LRKKFMIRTPLERECLTGGDCFLLLQCKEIETNF